ncbi:5'-nucleotidase C-terminal domain-containing protein [Nafulsella turpanensis]|uniref:5'-nucleotidase C-terminal domain-containing protein n=1 Tax=Nafulsella turpanensis TaxID=1265690 RepID=UPI00034979EB|nr:5'-nucleotidase [Nafulsella turpanensis]
MKYNSYRKYLYFLLFVLTAGSSGCKTGAYSAIKVQEASALQVDSMLVPDPEIVEIILPYKVKLDAEMDKVIGRAAFELTKGPVESSLGNFVADLIEDKAEEYSGIEVDMGAVTTGGLRVPIAEGPIQLSELFELMPFENTIWILELNGEQTRELFAYAAERQNIAISNSKLIVAGDEAVHIEIGGETFNPDRTYTLAISDYLASGGDDLFFLKEARVLEKLPVKQRDVIIEKVAEEEAAGRAIEAEIEGRVVIKEQR